MMQTGSLRVPLDRPVGLWDLRLSFRRSQVTRIYIGNRQCSIKILEEPVEEGGIVRFRGCDKEGTSFEGQFNKVACIGHVVVSMVAIMQPA